MYKSSSKCNLVQTGICEAFAKWRNSQKMKKSAKKVPTFESALVIPISDSDSESEGYNEIIPEIGDRELPFPFLEYNEEDEKDNIPSLHKAGCPENAPTAPNNIGVNKPKSNPQLTHPEACSTPLKLSKSTVNNSHVGILDISNISENGTKTYSESDLVSDTFSESTVIYQESTSPNKSINIIEHRIIPPTINKMNCSDYSTNVTRPVDESVYNHDILQEGTDSLACPSSIRGRVITEEMVSKRRKVNIASKESKHHLSKRLFDEKESEKLPNSNVDKQNLNSSKSAEERNIDIDAKRKLESHNERVPKKQKVAERRKSANDGSKSTKINVENAFIATEKEGNENVQADQSTKSTSNLEKGKLPKNMKENRRASEPSCSTSSLAVNISESAHVTEKESNKNESGELTKNTQSMSKGKTLLKITDVSQSFSKTDGHPSSNSPGKAKIQAKAEGKQINVRYVTLIQELFDTVYQSNNINNLLGDDKRAVDIFRDMNTNYQYACVKLFTWQRRWYNIFKFCGRINLGIGDSNICEMYNFLKENGIVDTEFVNDDTRKLLELLDPNDLKSIRDIFKLKKTLVNKQDIINSLLRCCSTQSTLTPKKSTRSILMEEIEQRLGYSVRLNEGFQDAFYRTYVLATYANPVFSKMTDYFKNVLHLRIAFPDYPIENYTVFYTKDEFIRYVKARKYKDGLEEVLGKHHLESLQICKTIFVELQKTKHDENDYESRYRNTPHLIQFTARAVYVSALSLAMSILATKFPTDAKEWLEYMIKEVNFPHRIGEWYYHLSWLYMNYLEPRDYTHAAKLIIEVLQEKKEHLAEVQLHQLGKRGQALKVTKKYKISQLYHDTIAELVPEPIDINGFPSTTIDASTIRSNELGKKRNYFVLDNEGNKTVLSVEYIALNYYLENSYTNGEHCEGSLIMATFTLFFWDIIYSANLIIPGTFVSKVQSVPLDIYTKYFYLNRKNAIDKRLEEIETTWSDVELIEFVKGKYVKYSHLEALCVVDTIIKDVELLEVLIGCVGRVVLAKIYKRLVKSIRHYRSGLPDLLIWNVHNKRSKFVEVKGENDKLSLGQTLWLNYLQSIGADIEVCKVHSIGSKRKKIRKPADKMVEEPTTSSPSVASKGKKKVRKVEEKASKETSTSSTSGACKHIKIQKSEDKVSTEPTTSSSSVPSKGKKKIQKVEEKLSVEANTSSASSGSKSKRSIQRIEDESTSGDEFE